MGDPRWESLCLLLAAEQPQAHGTDGKLRQQLQSPALVVLLQEADTRREGSGSQPTPRPQGLQQTHPLRHRLPGVPSWPGRAPLLPPHPQETSHRRGVSR